jgi:FHS family L-fucose permease-like MFS transporter
MKNIVRLLPVFIAFYCMGFVDIVGTAVNFASVDFALSPTTTQFLTFMIFIWFLVFSIPTGVIQDRIGKKNMVLIALVVTTLAMIAPFIIYNFNVLIISFALLGIGNTIIQVSLNPLLYDVSPSGSYSSNMSLSQFIKSIAAFFGPLLAVFFANFLGDWKIVFLLYAALSIISMIWLYFTPINESKKQDKPAAFGPCFRLLGNRFVLSMVLGIFIVVGLDVGMNTGVPLFLSKYGLTADQAVKSISIYIFALMTSRFLGALLLKKIPSSFFLLLSALITIAGLVLLLFSFNPLLAKTAIILVGFGSANIFPLIFSISVERMPERSNEISGLMIMAISGGAVFPFLMGIITDQVSLSASILFLLLISLYLGVLGLSNLKKGA